MLEDESYRPKIFYSTGSMKGMSELFPPPTVPLVRRQLADNEDKAAEEAKRSAFADRGARWGNDEELEKLWDKMASEKSY